MHSKISIGLTRFLTAVVAALTLCDAVLTVTAPWWLTLINKISYQDLRIMLGGIFQGARSNGSYPVYLSFTILCGLLSLGILISALRILTRIRQNDPFCFRNADNFKNAAFFAFALSLVFLMKMTFSASILTLICAGVFLLGGLFLMVLSELFQTAARIKEENELTI